MSSSLRVIFMGSPEFAVPALNALHKAGHEIICVYSQPPRPKGRGKQVQPCPVHQAAEELGLPVRTPISFKKEPDAVTAFQELNADIAVVAAYGLILPESVLNAPTYGCLNIHASLLPRWRGASPIQHAIWKGDTETGVTIMQMEKGLDTGPMIEKRSLPITEETTTPELSEALSHLGAAAIVDVLRKLPQLEAVPQDDRLSNYAPLLSREDGHIDWTQTAADIHRQIRALNPWPGTWTLLNGDRLKILKAHISPSPVMEGSETKPFGTLIDKTGIIACGENSFLQLDTIQPPNAKAMDIASAVNGNYLKVGESLA